MFQIPKISSAQVKQHAQSFANQVAAGTDRTIAVAKEALLLGGLVATSSPAAFLISGSLAHAYLPLCRGSFLCSSIFASVATTCVQSARRALIVRYLASQAEPSAAVSEKSSKNVIAPRNAANDNAVKV